MHPLVVRECFGIVPKGVGGLFEKLTLNYCNSGLHAKNCRLTITNLFGGPTCAVLTPITFLVTVLENLFPAY